MQISQTGIDQGFIGKLVLTGSYAGRYTSRIKGSVCRVQGKR